MTKQLLREFLCDYPLYKKAVFTVPGEIGAWPYISLQMYCEKCRSTQTFVSKDHFGFTPTSYIPVKGQILSTEFACVACSRASVRFYIKVDYDLQFIVKVGQDPAWEPGTEEVILTALGTSALYYRKARICEVQELGVGALAYYRKSLPYLIEALLRALHVWFDGTACENHQFELEEASASDDLRVKLTIARKLLPQILQPGSLNPLELLEGIYMMNDRPGESESLVNAKLFRQAMVFVVEQMFTLQTRNARFVKSIQELIQERAEVVPNADQLCAGEGFQELAGFLMVREDETAHFTNSERITSKTRSLEDPPKC